MPERHGGWVVQVDLKADLAEGLSGKSIGSHVGTLAWSKRRKL